MLELTPEGGDVAYDLPFGSHPRITFPLPDQPVPL